MLQAIIHNKINHAISDGTFHGIEDTKTSSVFGLIQYLPDNLFWVILKGACGLSTKDMPERIGKVLDYHFWEHFDSTGTTNTNHVEPDVWIECEEYDIIIEAKRSDSSGDNAQCEEQWSNQIISHSNYYENNTKPLIYIAIGGNDSLRDTTVQINGKTHVIHTASWYNLLNTVLNELRHYESNSESLNIRRNLYDIIQALQIHHVIKTVWLESLLKTNIRECSDISLHELWEFDNTSKLEKIKHYNINTTDLSKIWIIVK